MSRQTTAARRYFVRGRVQGVGFRWFVEHAAVELGLSGYVRNLDDGRVEVYAVGPAERLSALAGLLWKGPRWSEVRGVEEQEAAVQKYGSFRIEG
ncbi:MAG: acylphosphatase [Acidobacteria bacterium]|nr:acylphosphatase [Acidobacteriota bacterium]